MVASEDIGAEAATLLTGPTWSGHRVIELGSQRSPHSAIHDAAACRCRSKTIAVSPGFEIRAAVNIFDVLRQRILRKTNRVVLEPLRALLTIPSFV
jgi:hypothetical protein